MPSKYLSINQLLSLPCQAIVKISDSPLRTAKIGELFINQLNPMASRSNLTLSIRSRLTNVVNFSGASPRTERIATCSHRLALALANRLRL
jgi:hypothetical protein